MPKFTNQSTGTTIIIEPGQSIKDACQANMEIGIPFACENGICSTCLVTVEKGGESLGDKSEQEELTLGARMAGEEDRLLCQCQMGDVDIEVSQ